MPKGNLNILFKTQRQWLFWPIIIALAIAAVFYILYLNNNFYKEYSSTIAKLSESPSFGPRSRVYIDFGGGVKRAFEGKVLGSMAINIIIEAVSESGNLEVVFSKDQKTLSSLGGVANGSRKKWSVYLNDDTKPIENILVSMRPGDKISLVYK